MVRTLTGRQSLRNVVRYVVKTAALPQLPQSKDGKMNLTRQLLVMVAGAVVLASCATAPKPAPASTAPAPAPQAIAAVPSDLTAELNQAKQMKAEIDQYGLGTQVPDAYQQGSAALTAGEQAMGTDNATAKAKLDESIASFKKVIDTGFPALIQAREKQLASAKSAALAAKADRAVPDQFGKAQGLEKQAAEKQSAGDYAGADDLLGQAVDAYNQATSAANEQRAEAAQALKDAGTQIDQTKSKIETLQQGLKADQAQTGAAAGGGQ